MRAQDDPRSRGSGLERRDGGLSGLSRFHFIHAVDRALEAARAMIENADFTSTAVRKRARTYRLCTSLALT
jgi:hypothetical protein